MPLRYLLARDLYITQRYFVLFLKDFHDTQYGFKAIDRKSLTKIINKQTIIGGMFDIEYVHIALKNKIRIKKYRVNNLP